MAFLIFLAVGAGILALAAVTWFWARPKPGKITALVALDTSNGEAEAALWAQRLRESGIWCRLRYTPIVPGRFPDIIHHYIGRPRYWQLWVKERDEDEARKALGMYE